MSWLDPNRMPRRAKQFILVLLDMAAVPIALWSSFALRLGTPFPPLEGLAWLFVVAPLLAVPVFIRQGLYRAVIRFMGPQVVWAVLKGVGLSTLMLAAVVLLSGVKGVPRSVFIIYWGAATIYIGVSRLMLRAYVRSILGTGQPKTAVAIYGAGSAGVQLANAMRGGRDHEPVAFVDDRSTTHGTTINGLRVHSPAELPQLIASMRIRQILLALPAATRAERRAIVDRLEPLPVHVLTVPSIGDLLAGKARVDDVREVDIEDLLGRDSVQPDRSLLNACISGKSVMVTGAGGSIGSELCRQILKLEPVRLVLFEASEFALYSIERELAGLARKDRAGTEIVPLLGNVVDTWRIGAAMRAYGVQTVYHAAAYKHVPMVEHNVAEGVRNNTLGTLHAAEAAQRNGVETFVLISTDKAVRPTNVMGASKRLAELVLQALAREVEARGVGPRYCMVRFGNVLGSSGSVVPLFRDQIHRGGPVTVTHPDIIRYFMTIPEAAQLVVQAGSMGSGGDVFVLDMGEPVRIADLARKMIHLMGLKTRDDEHPHGDIAIEFTGLRPGEKLYEELLIGDNAAGTQHPRIMRAEERMLPWNQLSPHLERLERACIENDVATIRATLLETVHGYAPDGEGDDLLWSASATLRRPRAAVVPMEPYRR